MKTKIIEKYWKNDRNKQKLTNNSPAEQMVDLKKWTVTVKIYAVQNIKNELFNVEERDIFMDHLINKFLNLNKA